MRLSSNAEGVSLRASQMPVLPVKGLVAEEINLPIGTNKRHYL